MLQVFGISIEIQLYKNKVPTLENISLYGIYGKD